MARVPWRFQADIEYGVSDPDVTVFMGDTYTNDETQEKTVHKDTTNPEVVKLSALSSFLSGAKPASKKK